MLPPKPSIPPDQQRLLALYRGLAPDARKTLLRFAEFLAREAAAPPTDVEQPPAQPLDIPRPANESVIAAIRRLTATFPMLQRDALLHEASALMTAHVMHGRAAEDVIDELEIVFRRHYESVKSAPTETD